MGSVKELENRGVVQILLFLYDRGKTKVTDIDVDASSGTVYRALDTLNRLGLINEERTKPYTRRIYLTREGEAVAQKLKQAEEILETKRARQNGSRTGKP